MSLTAGMAAYKSAFQISPIFLTGGIAKNMPGGTLPLTVITEALNLGSLVAGFGSGPSTDSFFANFQPLPGGTMIENKFGLYAMANQNVAANAVIGQPLVISMLMIVPIRSPAGWATKLATMMALQFALTNHVNSGGTFLVLTPALIYPDCLLRVVRDVTEQSSTQPQVKWQIDFFAPLLTADRAASAQNAQMSQLSAGLPNPGNNSGPVSGMISQQSATVFPQAHVGQQAFGLS
jgi:hypothetical protein